MSTDRDREVGRRVRAARAYKGLRSVPALSEAIGEGGLGTTTLYEIERGERYAEPRELAAIAKACTLPAEFFTMDFRAAAQALDERSEVSRLRTDVKELQEHLRRLQVQKQVAEVEEHERTDEDARSRIDRPQP